jgi:hypothetical protein
VLSFFLWHGQQQYSSSRSVFIFTTIGSVTGPSSPLVDVHEFLPQVEDDNILEVVDVLLIRVNSWGIHPMHETAVIWLFGVLQKP